MIAKFEHLPLEFTPGTDYRYSNSNYNLLAYVIEKVSGERYGDYLERHILKPAGMRDSGNDGDPFALIAGTSRGYEPAGTSGYENAPYLDWSNKTGNGSLYSTVGDLLRFDRALEGDALLHRETREKYFAAGRGNRYGWFIGRATGHLRMKMNGRSPGFASELDRYPEDQVTIVVLSNSYATDAQDPIASGIADIVFGRRAPVPPEMKAAPVAESVLASRAGRYRFGPDYFVPNGQAEVTANRGYLLFQLADFRTPLVPLPDGSYLERNFFGHVTFAAGKNGEPDTITYHYGKMAFVAHRVAAD